MIYSRTFGRGQRHIVFVHGLTCDHTDWQLQIDALQEEARCTSVDLRGHGRSVNLEAPYDIDTLATDVIALCKAQEITSAVFVGHSMGTRVIASIAELTRNTSMDALVRSLVFVDGSKQAEDNPAAVLEAIQSQFIETQSARRFIENLFVPMFTDQTDATLRNSILTRAVDTPPTIFQALISGMLNWDAERMHSVLSKLTMPLYVVQSTTVNEQRERTCLTANQSTPYLDMLRRCVPHAHINTVANTGHFTQFDAPDHVNRAIRSAMDAL